MKTWSVPVNIISGKCTVFVLAETREEAIKLLDMDRDLSWSIVEGSESWDGEYNDDEIEENEDQVCYEAEISRLTKLGQAMYEAIKEDEIDGTMNQFRAAKAWEEK